MYVDCMQVQQEANQLKCYIRALKVLAALVSELRDDILMMQSKAETSLTEHEMCRIGLGDYVVKVQEEYSKSVRDLAGAFYLFTQAMMLPGMPKPTFNQTVVSNTHEQMSSIMICIDEVLQNHNVHC